MNKKEIEQEMKRYEEMDFGYWQMLEIRKGLESGVDVSKYASPKFDFWQMLEIRKGLEKEKQKELEMEM